ncbi:hypothetical protein ACTXT7_005513 [Hymenolepis weldensis]
MANFMRNSALIDSGDMSMLLVYKMHASMPRSAQFVGISLTNVPSNSIDAHNADRLDSKRIAYRPPPELPNCPPTTMLEICECTVQRESLAADVPKYAVGVITSYVSLDSPEGSALHAYRTLTTAKKNYSQTKEQSLAIIFAIKQSYKFLYNDMIIGPGLFILNFADRIVIPPTIKRAVLQQFHSSHQDVTCMKSTLKTLAYGPGIDGDSKAVVQGCSKC